MASPELRSQAFGPYIIERQIGGGGMGIVYRASHESTGQAVALKSVRLRSPELLASFRREVHALAMVRHPGIVRIIDHGVTGKNPWYAMELIEGQTLSQYWAKLRHEKTGVFRTAGVSGIEHRPLTDTEFGDQISVRPNAAPPLALGEFTAISRGICRAISFLHGRGLVHRDLKPENILIRDGVPVLVDFGLVAQFSGAGGREVLELADVAGTFAYMAPEQRFGRFVDARADLFSLGCIMYEWLTGAPPFGPGGMQSGVGLAPPSAHRGDVSPELDALVMRLIAKDAKDRLGYADDVDAALARIEGVEGSDSGTRSFYLYRSALAGRHQVLPRLEASLASALDGESKVVLISGESGCGKTRLVVELAARAADRRMQVVAGECRAVAAEASESGAGLGAPLQPFRQFLQTVVDACRSGGSAKARRLLGERASLLVPYEPSLSEFINEADAAASQLPPQTARARLFESLKELLLDYAREQPALLMLDDLQWADDLSIEFLSYLADGISKANAPLLVVGTCRIEEMGKRLRTLADNPTVSLENLPRFDHGAVKEMVSGMLALAEPPDVLIDFVAEESHGNPFFIAEYLRAATEAGLLRRDGAGRWHLSSTVAEVGELRQRIEAPPTISAMVALRLRDLGPMSMDVLRAAAVLGREFDVELVARTAGLVPAAVLDAYASLRPRNILEEDGAGVSRFAHDKLREITYTETTADQRTKLHERAARALEERYASSEEMPRLGELGFHHARAGARARAAEYYERAGQQAQEAYANEDAIRFFRLALEQTEAERELPEAQTRLRERIADGLMIVGRPAEAREILDVELSALPGSFGGHDRARWRRKLAQTWERQHRHIDALAAYSSAELALAEAPSTQEADARWWSEFVQVQVDKAWSLYFLARVDELTALVERARPAVIRYATAVQLERFLECQVMGSLKRERLRISDETLEHSRALLEAGERCGETRGLANARFIRGFVLLMRGCDEEAEPFFIAAIETAERMDDALLRTRFLSYYSILHRRLERLTEARSAAESLLSYASERGMFDYVGVAQAHLAWFAWRTGAFEDSERYALAALASWDKLRPAYVYPLQWLARMPLVAYLHRMGRIPEMHVHWQGLLEDPQQLLPASLQGVIELALSSNEPQSHAQAIAEAARLRYL